MMGRFNEDVELTIKAGWLKWKIAFGVLCYQQISIRLKDKFYIIAIKPARPMEKNVGL